MSKLYTSKPSITSEELLKIGEVFKTSWLGYGSFVHEFEQELGKILGAKNVIAVNSGTSALHLALEVAGIHKGDEVILPSLTFCATVQAVTILGATPVFCEVNSDNLSIDIDDVRSKITPKTRAIIPVHFCGIACDMDSLMQLKEETNIRIVEDAAHAFGSSYKGKKIGSFGDICCFSFDPIKNITCGEGGAIIVNDDNIADLLKKKRLLGIDKSAWARQSHNNDLFYDVTTQGYRYHMSNINAAIGLVQLGKMNLFLEKKRRIVEIYNQRLGKLKHVKLLSWNLSETFPFAYVIRIKDGLRDPLISHLSKYDIYAGINYIPNHLHSFFKFDCKLPVTEGLYSEILTLPLYYDLGFDEVEYVIKTIEEYFDKLDD